MSFIHIILALCLGVSLSAACGFRVFVPLLATSLGVRFCGMEVNETLAWIGSDIAIVGLATATVVEIIGIYIPCIGTALEAMSAPLAAIAGAVIAAGVLPEMPEFAKWSLAIVVGAVPAGTVHLGTTAVRGVSTTTTGGAGDAVVATAENGASIMGSIIAIVISPIVAIIGLCILLWVACRLYKWWKKRRTPKPTPQLA